MTVRLSGFRELEKALSELPKATGKNVLRRVAKGALEPMADVAASIAPHRTGKLAYSITVSEKRTRRVARERGFDRKTGIEMAMGPTTGLGTLQYASYDEFGTVDTPAFAYMRGAWDTQSHGSLEYIKDNLWREIDKSAAKYARKLAK